MLKPVFLSASVPDPTRHEKYFKTGNSVAIRDAVIALVNVVLPRTKLVFGGHPAITPMVKWVADELHAFERVRMFQSTLYREAYLPDLKQFRYEEVERVGNDMDASLLAMRLQMLRCEEFGAAFFIGGMDGVEKEYELLKEIDRSVPRFPVYTTGGAAQGLWESEWESRSRPSYDSGPAWQTQILDLMKTKTSYVSLFTKALEEAEARSVKAARTLIGR